MEKQKSNKGIELKLRIDWSELDVFGHVNNVVYFKYMQAGRVNYWEKMGLYGSYRESGLGPILVSAKCDFKKPLFYPGEVRIVTALQFIRTTSFGFRHLLFDEAGDVVAEAEDVVVMFDFNRNEKIPVPETFREAAIDLTPGFPSQD